MKECSAFRYELETATLDTDCEDVMLFIKPISIFKISKHNRFMHHTGRASTILSWLQGIYLGHTFQFD